MESDQWFVLVRFIGIDLLQNATHLDFLWGANATDLAIDPAAAQFDEWFNLEGTEAQPADVLAQLHKILRPFLLRRLKAEVEKDLPAKKEIKLLIGMSEMQTMWRVSAPPGVATSRMSEASEHHMNSSHTVSDLTCTLQSRWIRRRRALP